jgi:hypothetical protein
MLSGDFKTFYVMGSVTNVQFNYHSFIIWQGKGVGELIIYILICII